MVSAAAAATTTTARGRANGAGGEDVVSGGSRKGRAEEKPVAAGSPPATSRPSQSTTAGAIASADSSVGVSGVGNGGGATPPAVSDSAHESCMSRDDLLAQVRERWGFASPREGVFLHKELVLLSYTLV